MSPASAVTKNGTMYNAWLAMMARESLRLEMARTGWMKFKAGMHCSPEEN